MKGGRNLGKAAPFMVPKMDISINMLTAAEACFEMNPEPQIERWWCTKLCTNRDAKKCHVPNMYQTKTATKGNKRQQNKNAENR